MARVLLVDDEAQVRASLAAFLEACGYEVRVAANGVEALTALGSFPAEVVVTDINMPDMDGIEIVTALREAATNVGVIAMSGGGLFGAGLLLDSAAALGADVAIEKPLDLDALRHAIEAVLSQRRESAGGS